MLDRLTIRWRTVENGEAVAWFEEISLPPQQGKTVVAACAALMNVLVDYTKPPPNEPDNNIKH